MKGTPGERNWAATVTATPSPVPTRFKTPTPRPPTPFAHMVINEFLPWAGTDWNQDRVIDVYDEFIEVKNLGPIDVDIRGWKLDNISSVGSSAFILPSKILKPDDRAIFYASLSRISLHDSGGTVRLTNTRGIVIDARSYGPVADPDETHCRIPDGFTGASRVSRRRGMKTNSRVRRRSRRPTRRGTRRPAYCRTRCRMCSATRNATALGAIYSTRNSGTTSRGSRISRCWTCSASGGRS